MVTATGRELGSVGASARRGPVEGGTGKMEERGWKGSCGQGWCTGSGSREAEVQWMSGRHGGCRRGGGGHGISGGGCSAGGDDGVGDGASPFPWQIKQIAGA